MAVQLQDLKRFQQLKVVKLEAGDPSLKKKNLSLERACFQHVKQEILACFQHLYKSSRHVSFFAFQEVPCSVRVSSRLLQAYHEGMTEPSWHPPPQSLLRKEGKEDSWARCELANHGCDR